MVMGEGRESGEWFFKYIDFSYKKVLNINICYFNKRLLN